jgi:hypothetical protein
VVSAGPLRSRHRWQRPTITRVPHSRDGTWGLKRTPTCTGLKSGPLRVRIEARRRGWRRAKLLRDLESNESIYFLWIGKPMELNERGSTTEGMENANLDARNHPLRDEAPLNCVSLRPSLDYEQGWGAVKGQDERCLSAPPLTALQPSRTRRKEKQIRRAATSALTFLTFS